jgi:hypothetical protein
MPLGVRGLKKALRISVLVACTATILYCGGSKSTSNQHRLSNLKYRAFVSNPLFPSGFGNSPVINIVDALKDQVSAANISLLGESNQPSIMEVTPDLSRTVVFSPNGNTVTVIDNKTEALADVAGSTTAIPTITLPGVTESMFIAKDNTSLYAAVPGAPIDGQSPGAVVAVNLGTGATTATIPVPAAHYVVGTPDGTHLLAFSDNSDNVTLISTALIGTNSDPRQPAGGIAGFHRPVWGIFSDNATAYIFNCGAQCGGTAAAGDDVAGISTFSIGSPAPSGISPLSAATYGILDGGALYVAGTPPNTACPAGTASQNCGTLNIVDPNSLRPTNAKPILITDGYHNRMQMASNGQLFIGAKSCTNINISGGEVRGCLSIFDTVHSKVVIAPVNGDATGIQPITGRTVVYVCQGGAFRIYSTTNDQLFIPPNSVNSNNGVTDNIVGQSYDVKLVDPPQS